MRFAKPLSKLPLIVLLALPKPPLGANTYHSLQRRCRLPPGNPLRFGVSIECGCLSVYAVRSWWRTKPQPVEPSMHSHTMMKHACTRRHSEHVRTGGGVQAQEARVAQDLIALHQQAQELHRMRGICAERGPAGSPAALVRAQVDTLMEQATALYLHVSDRTLHSNISIAGGAPRHAIF